MAPKFETSDLTVPEEIVLDKVRLGKIADLYGCDDEIDASQGGAWGRNREVRASFLYALCTEQLGPVHIGGIQIRGAKITGRLDLSFAELAHRLALRSCFFDADGPISFEQTRLPALALSGSHVPGLYAAGLQTRGDVKLDDGFTAQGRVLLVNAEIGGDLRCSDATFLGPEDWALHAERMIVKGAVFLNRGFMTDGEVRLLDAKLGALFCSNGSFARRAGVTLNAERMAVAGGVFLNDGFEAAGPVWLTGATISAQLICSGGTFSGQGYAFNGERMTVGGVFDWQPTTRPLGIVNLTDATVGKLCDSPDAWPTNPKGVNLDGFAYDSFEEPGTAKYRLDWMRRYYSNDRYVPQPYVQLAAYFRRAGRDADARTVMVGKEHARRASLPPWRRPWHWLFGLVVGYGYRLWRALIPLVFLVAVGAALFARADTDCLVVPQYTAEACNLVPTSDARELPTFQPILYALDTVLPIIDLRQNDFWTPEGAYRWWFWFSIVSGWALTTAVAAGLTRAVNPS